MQTAAKAFGVEIEKVGSNMVMKFGDGRITFVEGSKTYDLNGASVTTDTVVLQNGMFDIKTICRIFGKTFRESETSYALMDGGEQVDLYQAMIDRLAG